MGVDDDVCASYESNATCGGEYILNTLQKEGDAGQGHGTAESPVGVRPVELTQVPAHQAPQMIQDPSIKLLARRHA